MKFFGIRDDLILPEERKWNWGIDDSFRNLEGFFDHLCSKKTSLNGARLNPECPSIKGEIFKRVTSDGKRGALIQVAFSSAVLAREFRRLEPISAFEVSILVLMEQASCCTSVKTGSNFNWIPRLDFIGRVPIRETERRGNGTGGKRQVSGKVSYCGSGLFVGESRILETLLVTRENRFEGKFFDERIHLTWIAARLDSFREEWFISVRGVSNLFLC